MSTPKITIAIAGGGIAGLSLAAGLIQHPQITVHVYESQCTYPRTGAGLALHKNAIAAMDLIHPGLKKTYLGRANLMSRDEEVELATQVLLAEGVHSGRVIGQLGKARGRKTIAREDLVMGWIGLLPAGTISFGKKLHNVVLDDGRAKLEFVGGTTAKADCLIGADGVRSATRRYLLGENHPATAPKNHDQWYLYSRAVPMDEARQVVKEEWTRNVAILCGSKGYICSLPIDKGRILSCTFQAPGAFCGEPESFTTGSFHGYSEDARAIAELISRNPQQSWKIYDHDPAPKYYYGRVAMIGDAAHATGPFVGNGAGQAIEDAAVLNALFARVTNVSQIPTVFRAYDAVRRERSTNAISISRDVGRLYAYALEEVGTDPGRMQSYLTQAGSYLNDVDLEAQNADAIAVFEKLQSE
ncbi:hypothetical protein ASPVEDRAFT_140328 [Aspergillus versicolor CBS 583.65]|uniref:FAD-binding domain-containing protein n=1 Tax=Aspergillus versicolor CBS 583.65 TaxID=1036611 RepID=A0A1L9PYQ4_ASPVE|nr:uncharacterized protein ASPVEDRAFT_140328 [Aspergillus versicolor CBS 583.65]OJJ06644.1 hypothetical protein ASPVEDRAFT_140328 [Aspergillus versicolor CBS 583.65]